MTISREAVIWGYRLLLGREPESEQAITEKCSLSDELDLARALIQSDEFKLGGRFKTLFGATWSKEALTTSAPTTSTLGSALRSLLPSMSSNKLSTIRIKDLPTSVFRDERARRIAGSITYPTGEKNSLTNLSIEFHGEQKPEDLKGVQIVLNSIPSELFLGISHSEQVVRFGARCSGRWIFHLWGECEAVIGDDVTSNGVDCYMNKGGRLSIGNDCMFATAYIHVGDNHAIFDLETGAILNEVTSPNIELGAHVWIASRVTILANTKVGSGSILGAQSIVKGNFASCALIAGMPAKCVKSGISWTRSSSGENAHLVSKMLKGLGNTNLMPNSSEP